MYNKSLNEAPELQAAEVEAEVEAAAENTEGGEEGAELYDMQKLAELLGSSDEEEEVDDEEEEVDYESDEENEHIMQTAYALMEEMNMNEEEFAESGLLEMVIKEMQND